MYRIIGYNGNQISKHRKFRCMIEKSDKIDRHLRRNNQRPAYHFEADTKEQQQKIEEYYENN